MEKVLLKGRKHWWKRRKLLVTSNFSFSTSVFERFVLQTSNNQGLFEKGFIKISNLSSLGKKMFWKKGENADHQNSLLYQERFQKAFFLMSAKSRRFVVRCKNIPGITNSSVESTRQQHVLYVMA